MPQQIIRSNATQPTDVPRLRSAEKGVPFFRFSIKENSWVPDGRRFVCPSCFVLRSTDSVHNSVTFEILPRRTLPHERTLAALCSTAYLNLGSPAEI